MPSVFIGVPDDHDGLVCVDLDFEAAAALAVDRLADAGHRSIGLVGHPPVGLREVELPAAGARRRSSAAPPSAASRPPSRCPTRRGQRGAARPRRGARPARRRGDRASCCTATTRRTRSCSTSSPPAGRRRAGRRLDRLGRRDVRHRGVPSAARLDAARAAGVVRPRGRPRHAASCEGDASRPACTSSRPSTTTHGSVAPPAADRADRARSPPRALPSVSPSSKRFDNSVDPSTHQRNHRTTTSPTKEVRNEAHQNPRGRRVARRRGARPDRLLRLRLGGGDDTPQPLALRGRRQRHGQGLGRGDQDLRGGDRRHGRVRGEGLRADPARPRARCSTPTRRPTSWSTTRATRPPACSPSQGLLTDISTTRSTSTAGTTSSPRRCRPPRSTTRTASWASGSWYGVPNYGEFVEVYYNKDAFAAAGLEVPDHPRRVRRRARRLRRAGHHAARRVRRRVPARPALVPARALEGRPPVRQRLPALREPGRLAGRRDHLRHRDPAGLGRQGLHLDRTSRGLKAEDAGVGVHQRHCPIFVSGSWWYGRFVERDRPASSGARSSSPRRSSRPARRATCGSCPRRRRTRSSPTSSSTSRCAPRSRPSSATTAACPSPPTRPTSPTRRAQELIANFNALTEKDGLAVLPRLARAGFYDELERRAAGAGQRHQDARRRAAAARRAVRGRRRRTSSADPADAAGRSVRRARGIRLQPGRIHHVRRPRHAGRDEARRRRAAPPLRRPVEPDPRLQPERATGSTWCPASRCCTVIVVDPARVERLPHLHRVPRHPPARVDRPRQLGRALRRRGLLDLVRQLHRDDRRDGRRADARSASCSPRCSSTSSGKKFGGTARELPARHLLPAADPARRDRRRS